MPRLPNLDDYDKTPSDDDPADKPEFRHEEHEVPYADEGDDE